MKTLGKFWGGAALLALLTGCTVGSGATSVRTEVSIVVRDGGRPQGCDVNDPRLMRALAEAQAVLGHPLSLEIAFERMPRPYGPFCDALFEREIGVIPRDLEFIRDRYSVIFDYAQPRLTRIVLDYDGTRARSNVEFDDATGTFTFVMGSVARIPHDALRVGIQDSYYASLTALYQGRDPQDVSPEEYEALFFYLDHLIERAERSDAPDRRINGPDAVAILRVLELEGLIQPTNTELLSRIRAWLVNEADFFQGAYARHHGLVEQANPESNFRRAQRAWSEWFERSVSELSNDMLREVWPHLVMVRQGRVEHVVDVDMIEVGLNVIDRWIAAGSPTGRGDGSARLFSTIVCPVGDVVPNVIRADSSCRDPLLYRVALEDREHRERFVREVLRRENERLAHTTAAHFRRVGEMEDDVLFLYTMSEPHETQWRAMTRYLADQGIYHTDTGPRSTFSASLVDSAARLWRTHPERRASLLYLLARFDSNHGRNQGLVDWEHFSRTFGSAIDRDVFNQFLAHGVPALSAAFVVWPALSRGWNRVEVLLPHFIAHASTPRFRPAATLWTVVRQMSSSEASAVNAYLRRRVQEAPAEHQLWHGFTERR